MSLVTADKISYSAERMIHADIKRKPSFTK